MLVNGLYHMSLGDFFCGIVGGDADSVFTDSFADELAAVEVGDFVAVDHIDIEGVGLCGGDVAAECEGTE